MMNYCANCDNEATVLLRITEQLKTDSYPLLLCATCKAAFDWGTTHAADDIEESMLTIEHLT